MHNLSVSSAQRLVRCHDSVQTEHWGVPALDVLDGRVARWLGQKSDMGDMLDTLVDRDPDSE